MLKKIESRKNLTCVERMPVDRGHCDGPNWDHLWGTTYTMSSEIVEYEANECIDEGVESLSKYSMAARLFYLRNSHS